MSVAGVMPIADGSNASGVNECADLPPMGTAHLGRRWMEAAVLRRFGSRARSWNTSPQGIRNMARLEAMRNRHWGKRCFILGNGPSLLESDLGMLADEYVIGTNRIYLHPACRQWRRWYYCAVNPNVMEQYADEIRAIGAIRFLAWEHRALVEDGGATLWLESSNEPRFSFDLSRGLWQGATVTYVAMQVAFHLGFTDVVLLGVDHHYERAGQPNKLVTAEGTDPDHFSQEYFGPGCRWQLPDLGRSEVAYRLALLAFEQEGRRIRDATVGGRLNVFPKVDYSELF
ncbi:MAG TPA: hypothetical protein ENJ00_09900 [Phycisphaerales bacterium]|nr:hypothetical protein [Phycisphaerales bacterium]